MKGISKNYRDYSYLLVILFFVFLVSCNGVVSTEYTITATSGTGGSISPSGAVLVSEGTNQTFTITPDECYQNYEILIDGILVESTSTYTFTNVHQDYIIHVSFIPRKIYNADTGTNYDYIQDAIDASFSGETIIVCPGTYKENIEFNNSEITLQSKDPSDPTVVASTIIDGKNEDSVIRFSGEDASTVKGFTIQNGNAYCGGGINIENSSPIISNNIIINNIATTYGGGVNIYHSFPTITGNTITENESKNLGGGIYSEYSSPVVTGNNINQNKAISGGGVFLYSFSATITNNQIVNNLATSFGGGLYIESGDSYSIGGADSSDTTNFNTICSNSPNQMSPDDYPNNYIFTFCAI
ncbi:MAG: hypothetical protein APR54_07980 [Candidatus Cloacimonas sp. SDB]|nr:MAG: hypothetical protein APR54_07980 [Candidatus Cloacimonas sp. SDB]